MPAISQPRRRDLLVAAGLATAYPVKHAGRHPRVDASRKALDEIEAKLHTLVTNYGSSPVANTQAAAWSLAQRTSVSVRYAPVADRPDWTACCARALVLEANASADAGDTSAAIRTAGDAAAVARTIRDYPTVAHAFAVRAEVHAALGDWARASAIAEHAHVHAGHAPVSVMLTGSEAIARAEMGDGDGMRDALTRGRALMDALPDEAHGRIGYTMDTYHPALFASTAARALVRAGDVKAAAPYLEELREADGLETYSRLMDARAAMVGHEFDAAREHLADAILTAQEASRPTAWLVNAAAGMAREAEPHGVSMYDLVGAAQST